MLSPSSVQMQIFRNLARSFSSFARLCAVALCAVALRAAAADAQTADTSHVITLTGRVVASRDSQPVAGADVRIVGTSRVTRTGADGKFTFEDAPEGVFTVEARKFGFGQAAARDVRMARARSAGNSTELTTIVLKNERLRAQEVLSAGTAHSIPFDRTPFSADRIDSTDFPIPSTSSPLELLQGRIAGATALRSSGAPGADVFTSIRVPRPTLSALELLYVVDGVYLSNDNPNTLQDIESQDIVDIQVLKGPAASALYGVRAINGAIVMTTSRGNAIPVGKTEFKLRSEIGRDEVVEYFRPMRVHWFRVNANGDYVNAAGVVVPRAQRIASVTGIAETPFKEPIYDHGEQFFRRGLFNSQTLTARHNRAGGNAALSFSRTQQSGTVPNADGYWRQTIRLNGDKYFGTRVRIGLAASHTRADEEPFAGSFSNLMQFGPEIDLRAKEPSGLVPYIISPYGSEYGPINPLAQQLLTDRRVKRSRTLASINASYRALSWLTFDVAGSYDRARQTDSAVQRIFGELSGHVGERSVTSSLDTGYFTVLQAGATLSKRFGAFESRLMLRGESQNERHGFRTEFFYSKVFPVVKDTTGPQSTTESFTLSELKAGLAELQISSSQKYFADLLFRSEDHGQFGDAGPGLSSVRAGLSWIASNEGWYPGSSSHTLKIRFAHGRMDGVTRPYPSGSLGSSFTYQSAPSVASENEFGVDVALSSRAEMSVTRASTRSQSSVVSIGGLSWYSTRRIEFTGASTEARLNAQLVRRASGAQWSLGIIADRRRSKVARYNAGCFFDGTSSICEGSDLRTIWGFKAVTNKSELPAVHSNSQNAFDVNDDGFVVPVGPGNTWRDGKAKNLWGTMLTIDGVPYRWGYPFQTQPQNGLQGRERVGDGNPDVQFGIQNTVRFRGMRVFALLTGQVGGDLVNEEKQIRYGQGSHPDVDQSSKPDETRKPVGYYLALREVKPFVESAAYLRLAEASVGYVLNANNFPWLRAIGASAVELDLIGRNLFTSAEYDGLNLNRRLYAPGARFDFGYPPTRTFTLSTAIKF